MGASAYLEKLGEDYFKRSLRWNFDHEDSLWLLAVLATALIDELHRRVTLMKERNSIYGLRPFDHEGVREEDLEVLLGLISYRKGETSQ